MSIKRTMAGVLLVAVVTGTAGSILPAGAHAGHAAPFVTIDRPAAGKLYKNDVTQKGQVGGAANTAISIGNPLTMTFSWDCQPKSTSAKLTLVVTNTVTGAEVYNMGLGIFGPKDKHTPKAWTGEPGKYTITANVTCTHIETQPRGMITVEDGKDTDTRNVVVV